MHGRFAAPEKVRKQKDHPICIAAVLSLLPNCLLRTGSVFPCASASPSRLAGCMLLVPVWRQPGVSALPLGSKWCLKHHSPSSFITIASGISDGKYPDFVLRKLFCGDEERLFICLFRGSVWNKSLGPFYRQAFRSADTAKRNSLEARMESQTRQTRQCILVVPKAVPRSRIVVILPCVFVYDSG